MVKKYGSDKVAKIITYGTYGAKASVRAIGRSLNIPTSVVDKIAKMIPATPGTSLRDAFNQSQELVTAYETDSDAKNILDIAFSIEGNPSHTSSHAAGILVTPKPIDEYVPIIIDKDGNSVAAFDMNTLEELGLLKMDFLGLRNLDVIEKTRQMVKKTRGIDMSQEDVLALVDDPNSYHYVKRGTTCGLFQIESEGMAKYAREMNVSNIDECAALLALYRPGPMAYIPDYIRNKNNPDNIHMPFEALRPLLQDTYGIIVYQEQVMNMSKELAGFTPGMTDYLRKGLGKKKDEIILECKNQLLYGKTATDGNIIAPGAIALGHDRHTLENFYDDVVVPFGRYSFNKAHAVAYGFLTAETGGMKYYFPAEYFAALLTTVAGNQVKVYQYIKGAEEIGVKVLPPSINHSDREYTVDRDGNVRVSLSTLRDVGDNAVAAIVSEREEKGDYTSFSDFIYRCCDIGLDSKSLEGLIRAGVFIDLGHTKSSLLASCHSLFERIKKEKEKMVKREVMSLFTSCAYTYDDVPDIKEFPSDIFLKMEKHAIGIYMTGHPLHAFSSTMSRKTNLSSLDFVRELDEAGNMVKDYNLQHNDEAKVIGVVTDIRVIMTKKNDPMAFITIEDVYGAMSVTLFPSMYDMYKDEIKVEDVVYVYGVVNNDGKYDPSIVARRVDKLEQEYTKKVIIETTGYELDLYKLREKMGKICTTCRGDNPVYLLFKGSRMLLPKEFWVNEQGIDAIIEGIPNSKSIIE